MAQSLMVPLAAAGHEACLHLLRVSDVPSWECRSKAALPVQLQTGTMHAVAQICESLRKEGYANYVPAIIRSSDRNTVSFLARFHFKCYPRGYYYWAWKSWNDNSLNGFGQCDRCSISNGDGKQYSGSRSVAICPQQPCSSVTCVPAWGSSSP
jgi:hypothetical protein